MALVFVLISLLVPSRSYAFDYGPVWNDLFWVALGLWSMAVSYVLLKKKHAIWGLIGSFTHALLTPGVRPTRTHGIPHVRNPHIVADAHTIHTPAQSAVPVGPTRVHSSHPPTTHIPAQQHEHVHVLPQRPTVQQRAQSVPSTASHTAVQPVQIHDRTAVHAHPVVHSTHMSHTTHPTPPAPHAVSPAAVQTTDTLTLEIVAGVPKLILKREAKK